MVARVLVAFDGSEPANRALTHACKRFSEAEIVVLTVVDPNQQMGVATAPVDQEAWTAELRRIAEEQLDDAEALAATHDTEITRVSEVGPPAQTIVQYCEDNDIDHVVVGTHGRDGVSRVLLGSVAELIVRRAPVGVSVIR